MLTTDAPIFETGLSTIGHNTNGMPVTIMTWHAMQCTSKHAILRTARLKCTGITMTSWNSRLVTLIEEDFISNDSDAMIDIADAAYIKNAHYLLRDR